MDLKQALQSGTARLKQAGVPDASLDAWYLLEYVTGVTRASYLAHPEYRMTEEQKEAYALLVGRRASRVPLQHLTGVQEFMGLEFEVNEHVLIPRQDTETLVEYALSVAKSGRIPLDSRGTMRVLDLCTGSGCVLLSFLKFMEQYINKAAKSALSVTGTGSDLSEEALTVARRNAEKLCVKADFIQGDLLEPVEGTFGMILSNPPYIRSDEISGLQEEVRLHDPMMALDGMEDGLYFYRRITEEAGSYLEPGGILAYEIGFDQAEDVTKMMQAAGYDDIAVIQDLAGMDRVVAGVLREKR